MGERRQLASKSALIFAVRIGGAGVIFLAQAMIARLWGAAQLGEYLLAIAAANLMAIALPLGFQTVGSYFAAEYKAKNDGTTLSRFAVLAYGMAIFPGLALLYIVGQLIHLIGPAGTLLQSIWPTIAMMAFGTAIVNLNGAILVGLKKPFFGLFADTIFRPLFIVLGILIVLFIGVEDDRVGALIWWVAIFYLGLAMLHFFVTIKAIRELPRDTEMPAKEMQRWWVYALPWIIVALSSDFFFDIDLLLLSGLLDKEQIAIFGVCARIFVLASFGIIAIGAVVSPDLLDAEEKKDFAALEAKIGDANLVGTGLAIVLTIGVMIFSPLVFYFFGPEFNQGVMPLTILCSALIARAAFGPGAVILSSRKKPYASLPAILLGLVVLLVANYILVPMFGLVGAASAAAISFIIGAGAIWLTTWRLTGLNVSLAPALKKYLVRDAQS